MHHHQFHFHVWGIGQGFANLLSGTLFAQKLQVRILDACSLKKKVVPPILVFILFPLICTSCEKN